MSWKSYIPASWYRLYRSSRWYKRKSRFYGQSTESIFQEIYDQNHWSSQETVSGPGSELNRTKHLIEALNPIIRQFKIQSMLDLPCGDLNWMKQVDLEGVQYIGADVVPELIERNRKVYPGSNIQFQVLNMISDDLPTVDLMLCRDGMVHLSNQDILKTIENIKRSGSRYLLATTFPKIDLNLDIQTGNWHAINLQAAPFNLNKPELLIDEKKAGFTNDQFHKYLGLWEIKNI